jgi:hypothetical protein
LTFGRILSPIAASATSDGGDYPLGPRSNAARIFCDIASASLNEVVRGGLLCEVGDSSRFSVGFLRHEPEVEVGCSLHQREEVDALDSRGGLDRRNEPMEKGAELGALGWRHLTVVQQVPPGFDDDRAGA